jgi:hypothetical protein
MSEIQWIFDAHQGDEDAVYDVCKCTTMGPDIPTICADVTDHEVVVRP